MLKLSKSPATPTRYCVLHEVVMAKLRDISGRRFGRLLVSDEYQRERVKGGTKIMWRCKCDCGNEHLVQSGYLIRGDIKSCGCLYADERGTWCLKHGKSKTPEYNVWNGMMSRCYNEKTVHFEHYGGRGISVCYRWHDFECFLEDMGKRPARAQIDRIDSDGNYEPSNCRWVTTTEQSRNRKGIVLDEDTVSLIRTIALYSDKTRKEIAEDLGLAYTTVGNVINGSKWKDVAPMPV